MNDNLRRTCETFINNRDLLKENFRRERMAMHMMCAAILTSIEDAPDAEALLENEKILKKLEGIFSPFRGFLKLPVIINMAMSDDPEEYLKLVRKAYDLICSRKGSRNESFYIPAMSVALAASSEDEMAELIDESGMLDDGRDMDALLAELGLSGEELASDVKEAAEFLKNQKGFGALAGGSKMRESYAKMLVSIAVSRGSEAAELVAEDAVTKAIESRYRAMQSAHAHLLLQNQIMLQNQLLHIHHDI